jgi:predicted nuclease of restriction endonuclease-like RecB superfamily
MALKSKFEKQLNAQLKKLGVPFAYESTKIPYSIPQVYIPDFVLSYKGKTIYIEAKCYFRASDRRKHLQVQQEHPELDIRFVFVADNKLHSKSNTRYSQWCERHNFKYAFKKIPKEWLEEVYGPIRKHRKHKHKGYKGDDNGE